MIGPKLEMQTLEPAQHSNLTSYFFKNLVFLDVSACRLVDTSMCPLLKSVVEDIKFL